MPLAKAACAVGVERGDGRIDDRQADRGVGARRRHRRPDWPSQAMLATKSSITATLASARAISASSPPIDFAQSQRVDIVLDAEHRRRVDRLALEDAFDQLAARGQAEDLRQRPGRLVAFQPLDGARRQDQHAVRALAAQHLLPGEGDDIELVEIEVLREGGRGRVADGQALAVGRNEVGVRHAHARGRAVPGEDHVAVEIDLRRDRAARRSRPRCVRTSASFSCLTTSVTQPAPKTFPGDHVDAARAEQRPQRHLDRAGVGGRHDADAVVGRHLQHFAGEVDRLFELGLADLGAVRAAERGMRRAPRATSRDAWRRDLRKNWDLPDGVRAWRWSSSWFYPSR